MNRILILLACALLTACANPARIRIDSSGADAGQVVVGVGAATGTNYSGYSLLFRRAGSTDPEAFGGFSYPYADSTPRRTADYKTTSERGAVVVASLPAGEYEIYNFDIFLNGGTWQKNFASKVPLSIRFTVKPDEVTYLGNYQANGLRGDNVIGISIPAGAVFVITDRQESDMRLARSLTIPMHEKVRNATPNPQGLGNPFFVSPNVSKAAQAFGS